jgi:hypothetical protein
MKNFAKKELLVGLVTLAASFSPLEPAFAMSSSKPAAPPYTLPNPKRYVIVRPIQNVNGFETPNQVTTTLDQAQTELSAILAGVATNAGFSVIQDNQVASLDPCGQHLELWPAVTDFTLDDTTINLQFGFNSGGTLKVGSPQVSASDSVTFGSVKLEFTLYQCDNAVNGSCTSLVASEADQTVLGNNFSFSVTWSAFTVPGSILSQTNVSNALQSIMLSGVNQLMSSPQMANVPWSTTVLSVNSDGSYTIFAGQNANLATNQYFTIYSKANATSQCGVSQAIACAYTSEVDNSTSVVKVYQSLSQGNGVPIAVGDIVDVGASSCAPAEAKNTSQSLSSAMKVSSRGRI